MEEKKPKKKNTSKVLKTIIIILVCLITLGGGYLGYRKLKGNSETVNGENGDNLENRDYSGAVDTDNANNILLTETVWYNDYDNSALVFPDTTHFVWYADTDYANSQNYMAGMYTFYNGKSAYDMIASLYSEDEEKPEETDENSMLVLYILSSTSNGVEQVNEEPVVKYFFGYFTQYEIMSYIDMSTLDQYDFYYDIVNTTASKNAGKETSDDSVKLSDTYKDIVYADDTSAWQTFEIKFEGSTLTYPYSGIGLTANDWTCGAIDESTGFAQYTKEDGGTFDVRFANKNDDSIKMINIKENSGSLPEVILPNGITWYASVQDILSAYGEPTSYSTNDVDATIMNYETDKVTMQLTVMGEETYSQAGLIGIYISGK